MKSDETDQPADESDTMGVPSWSMKDDPDKSTSSAAVDEDRAPEPPAPEPRSEMMEPPSWSIMDSPEPPEDEPLDTSQSLDVGSDIDDEPLPDMDSGLFIEGEGELAGDDAISMLRQIPIEEVELSQDLEIELDLEVEEEELPQTEETPPAQPAQLAPEVAEKPTPTPRARVARPEPSPAAPSTSKDYEIKDDESQGRATSKRCDG